MPEWPPLAWLARCDARTLEIAVFHGPRVETATGWFCEAAWDGEFVDGGFDRTDIVTGSGGRLRDDGVTFVSAGSTVDRLHSFADDHGVAWISNSLPCLLAAIGGDVDPMYPRYGAFFHSIVGGLAKYERWLPTSAGRVQLTYFDNLRWADGELGVVAKPFRDRTFSEFASYRSFLERSMAAIVDNARSGKRASPIRSLGTLSSGYDSTAVAVLARQAGVTDVLTFPKAFGRSTIGDPDEDDSGASAAQILGFRCRTIRPSDRDGLPAVTFFAADAWGEDVHYLDAREHLAGRLLFTGYHGDKVWAKKAADVSENIVRGDLSGLSLTEFRLWAGFLHCPVPFWGGRAIAQIHAISNAAEMKPWDVDRAYSRPICRRIGEEAGIPREAFGIKKRATAVFPLSRQSFLTPGLADDYFRWLRGARVRWLRGRRVPPPTSRRLDALTMSAVHRFERLTEKITWSIGTRSGWRALPHYRAIRRLRTLTHPDHPEAPWTPAWRRYVFPWALAAAMAQYRQRRVS
jgi:hypothetical protein